MTDIAVTVTSDLDFIRHLQTGALGADRIALGKPARISGFGETLYEITAAIGLISLPVGVLGNLLASWIWDTVQKQKHPPEVHIALCFDHREELIELKGQDRAAIFDALTRALDRLGADGKPRA